MRFILYSLAELAVILLIFLAANMQGGISRGIAFGACLAIYEAVRDKHRRIAQ